jgi:uncharacterized membrane protein YgdD (TMEM256/DUF423 family)
MMTFREVGMDYARIGAVLGFLGVALGAFGAHALRDRLEPSLLQAWNTGVLYHLLHAVALFAFGLYARATGTAPGPGAALLLAGVVVFSGSLYALALTGIRPLGAITPVGGLLFLAGWAWIAVKAAR